MPEFPLAAYAPTASPAWRWDLARRLAPDLRRIRREHRADASLMAAITHLRGRPDADIAAARRLHETDGVRRWLVDAWLLAGLDDAQIARRTGLSSSVVGTYEPLFFAVRDSLPMTDWLLLHCVGPAAWRGFRRDEVRQLWALAAMSAGPLLVDRLVAPVLRVGTPTIDVYFDDAGLDPRLKRWIMAKTEPVAAPVATTEVRRQLAETAPDARSDAPRLERLLDALAPLPHGRSTGRTPSETPSRRTTGGGQARRRAATAVPTMLARVG